MIQFFRNLKRKVINKLPPASQLTIHTNNYNNTIEHVLSDISTTIINANDMGMQSINVNIMQGQQLLFFCGDDVSRSYATVPLNIFNNIPNTSFADMCNVIELKLNSLGYKTRHVSATGDGTNELLILTIYWGF